MLAVISSIYVCVKAPRDLRTLMLVPGVVFKQNGGNEITALPVLRTREP